MIGDTRLSYRLSRWAFPALLALALPLSLLDSLTTVQETGSPDETSTHSGSKADLTTQNGS